MNSAKYLMVASMSVVSAQCLASGFIEDGKASISLRTLYFENDVRETGGSDQRQTVQGVKFDYLSGYTNTLIGIGLDVQALAGINLGGGIDNQSPSTVNTVSPITSDGSPVDEWTRLGANAKFKFSKSELKAGNALAPNLPVVIANDGRVLPQVFQGAMFSSKEIDGLNVLAGKFDGGIGRASSNYSGLAVSGGARGVNNFTFGGVDWNVTKALTLQYYYGNLENYYSQNFVGLIHNLTINESQSFKSDLRYFRSRSSGKNGSDGYVFNNFGGYASSPGKVDNDTWSGIFTYSVVGHSFLLGYQQVSDDGAMVYLNSGSVRDRNNRPEGQGGASVYLFTDSMANSFVRAGERTTFGQYGYDFTAIGVPGLKASVTYLKGRNILDRDDTSKKHEEWERDMRLDYAVQSGVFQGLGMSLRRANFRTSIPGAQGGADVDQTRFYLIYNYSF